MNDSEKALLSEIAAGTGTKASKAVLKTHNPLSVLIHILPSGVIHPVTMPPCGRLTVLSTLKLSIL